MRNMLLETPRNNYQKGFKDAYEAFEKAVEEFMLLVSVGEMPSEIHACDFFAVKLHEILLDRR